MLQHLICYGLVVVASIVASSAQNPVLPSISDPQADFAPGVPRASTPGATPPEVLTQIDPKYSSDAMRAGVQGMTTLDAVIGADGFVERSRVRCSLHPSLDAEAQKALGGWTFKPALLNGVPTRFVVEVRMEFRLATGGAAPRLTVDPEGGFKVQSAGLRERRATGCTERVTASR